MDNVFKTGELSLDEWNGLWKCNDCDSDVTNDEYFNVCNEFRKKLDEYLEKSFDIDMDYTIYFRGDNYGDRTQYLDLGPGIPADLLTTIQQWLREDQYKNWRVLVQTNGYPIIYPKIIRFLSMYERHMLNYGISLSNLARMEIDKLSQNQQDKK